MNPSPLTAVLHVEDSPTDAMLTREELDQYPQFHLTQVDRLDEGLLILATGKYSVVLLDLGLPDSQGLDTLIRFQQVAPHIPVVVMTGNDDQEMGLRAVQYGAQDYVVKGRSREQLLDRTLRYAIERNLAKQALREREELFRGAFEHTNVAMVLTDMNHGFVRINAAFADMFGYSVAEMLQMSMPDITHPDDLAESYAQREQLLSGMSPFSQMEKRYLHKDGHVLWGLANLSLIRDESSHPILYVGQVQNITERKRAEESLKLFRALLDHTNDSIEVIDPDTGCYLDMNQKGCEILGYSRSEILQLGVADIAPDVAKRGWAVASEEVRRNGSLVRETQHQRKDGSVFPVEINAKLVRLDREYIVAVVRDITERKQTESERNALFQRLQLHIQRMPLAYILFDVDYRIVDWNSTAEQIFGYTKEEVLGTVPPFEKWVPPSFWEQEKEILRRLRMGDMNAHSVNENVTSDGCKIICEWFNTPLMDNDGQFIGAICMAQDVTSRQEAEQTLRLRDRAIQAVTQGILITDPKQPDNPIIYASPSVSLMTGYSFEEVRGRNCRSLQGALTDRATVARVREAIQKQKPCTEVLLNYRKDGTTFWNELSIAPVTDHNGALTHFVGVQTDVTERRQLEDQFRQAQKMEAIGQLAGGVAHDFNNLLTIISGYSEILLSKMKSTDPMCRHINAISEAGKRAASLTRQLLAFSRKTVLEPRVLDLNDVVLETEKFLRRLIGEDIHYMSHLDPTISRVKVDPDQLGQVVLNLAVNARDAMPKGGELKVDTKNAELTLDYTQTRPDVSPGHYVLLEMTDTGCGMTPEVKARIFEPFFTTKGVGKGTGLGLSMVIGIVKQSGGHIEVASEPDIGTTFQVYLPAVREKASAVKETVNGNGGHGTETVLLVEDEDGIRELAALVLETFGYTVLAASNGRQALQIAENNKHKIDILVTDVVMPGMSGPELAEELRPLIPKMKVLFESGYTDDAVVRHGLLHEKVAFLQKPYTPAALVAKVRKVLDEK